MKTSLQIAAAAPLASIQTIAEQLGVPEKFVEPHGRYKAKLDLRLLDTGRPRRGAHGLGAISQSCSNLNGRGARS